MKKAILLLLTVVLCISFTSCRASDVPEGMQLASGKEVAYTLYVPVLWHLTSEDGLYGAYYSAEDASSVTVTSYAPEAGVTGIADYWQMCRQSYEAVYQNFALREEGAETVLGGKAALRYEFDATIDGGSYRFQQIMAIHGNQIYLLTYASTGEQYEAHMEDVARILETFEFR